VARKAPGVAKLERLLAKFGDVRLSEAIAMLSRPRGAPKTWGVHELLMIFLDVEAAKGRGLNQRQACTLIAPYYDLTLKNCEKIYIRSRKHFEPLIRHRPARINLNDMVQDHVQGRPRLQKLLERSAAKNR